MSLRRIHGMASLLSTTVSFLILPLEGLQSLKWDFIHTIGVTYNTVYGTYCSTVLVIILSERWYAYAMYIIKLKGISPVTSLDTELESDKEKGECCKRECQNKKKITKWFALCSKVGDDGQVTSCCNDKFQLIVNLRDEEKIPPTLSWR